MANIVDNLLGILGSKKAEGEKKGKYFLELDETEDPKPSQVAAKVESAVSQAADNVSKAVESIKPQVEEAASQVGEKVSQAVGSIKPQVEEVASQVGDKVSEVVDSVKAEVTSDSSKKGKRPSVKDKATKKQQAKSEATPAVAAQPAAPKAAKPAEPDIKTFAPDYLNTVFVTSSRRTPGPSLNSFKKMANEVVRRK